MGCGSALSGSRLVAIASFKCGVVQAWVFRLAKPARQRRLQCRERERAGRVQRRDLRLYTPAPWQAACLRACAWGILRACSILEGGESPDS